MDFWEIIGLLVLIFIVCRILTAFFPVVRYIALIAAIGLSIFGGIAKESWFGFFFYLIGSCIVVGIFFFGGDDDKTCPHCGGEAIAKINLPGKPYKYSCRNGHFW